MSNRQPIQINQNIAKYVASHHPDVFQEAEQKLKAIPCSAELVERVVNLAYLHSEETWKVRLLAIISVLLLCSPESILTDIKIKNGVSKLLSDALGVTSQAISGKMDQCRFYYSKTSWVRDTVHEILEEVRGDE
ncbi:hypothetical protein K7A41_23430 [Sphingobacterium sp. InxBP1]|uniref:hypothetical protein n=1 Tax=Sphingobacterium sp. InxBP1 TaxID=2870328 RepID=UPI002243ECEF|nr:hypothetical protein [Sphingobacterium sp. InxBP1]MCW8314198.1 hypothetical protein [Sphingobacterium sp. InxBP1]